MGFLRRVFGGSVHREPSLPPTASGGTPTLVAGPDDLEVVGESFYQESLRRLAGPTEERVRVAVTATLLAELDNQYDPNAISIWVDGSKVGHLSREDAAMFRPGLLDLQRQFGTRIALRGVIVGGGPDRPSLGVFLRCDAAAFGLEGPQRTSGPPVEAKIRTGLRNAVSGDEADDSYDLGWQSRLPGDRLKAMTFLRSELVAEVAPLSRHYMYCQLEELLYGARDDLATALDDFDAVCEAHHKEMAGVRLALIATFGGLPLLETYQQAAIRHQKAHDWVSALHWAQAGIAVYGTDALDPASVDDLVRRVANYHEQLQPKAARPAMTRCRPGPTEPISETLICEACGRTFVRTRSRGRKPLRCPECRGLVTSHAGRANANPRTID